MKKKIYFWLRLIEEGIAYYLTFRWVLIILACFISLFSTFFFKWLLRQYFNILVDSNLLFFLIWLLVLLALIYEFPLPHSIKDKLYEEFYSDKKDNEK